MRLHLAPLLLCLTAVSLPGQYIAKRVLFLNSGSYSQADLLKLEPLQPGQSFSQADLQAAAGALADTGYFDDVQASLDGSINSIDVRFQLVPTDNSKLFQPTYRNFVWLSPAELADFTRSVPLLSFGIPESGTQQTTVQAALEQRLASHSVTAKVSCNVIEPSTFHPQGAVEYSVAWPQIRINKAELDGVAPSMASAVNTILQHIHNTPYSESKTDSSTAELLLSPWLNAGYIDAHLESFQRAVDPASTDKLVLVDLHATVVPGESYKLNALKFTGTSVESAQQFAATTRLHPGDPASRASLLASLAPVNDAYRSQGYQDEIVNAIPSRNSATHEVAYTIKVVPGVQYRIRDITVNGLSPKARADFDSAFQLHSGDIYNEVYVRNFFHQNKSIHSLDDYGATFAASAEPKTQLLDLTINFVSGGAPGPQ